MNSTPTPASLLQIPGRPPKAQDVTQASSRLAALRDSGADVAQLADDIELVVDGAVRAGAITRDVTTRDELRRIVLDWTIALRRLGRSVSLRPLEAYSRALPTLEPIDADEVIALVKSKEPITARRIEPETDLRGLPSEGVKIVDCQLEGCDLRNVRLERARFIHTTFIDCKFGGATLDEVIATSSIFLRGSFEVKHAVNATFNGTRFESISLRDGDFSDSSFGATNLIDVDASSANFTYALFDLAELNRVALTDSTLVKALFIGASLRESTFSAADLRLSIFSSSSVATSDFSGAILEDASFEKAEDVQSATFDASAVDVAVFSPADKDWIATAMLPEPAPATDVP